MKTVSNLSMNVFIATTIITYVSCSSTYHIMKYGSTPYIGMAPKKSGCSIVCV